MAKFIEHLCEGHYNNLTDACREIGKLRTANEKLREDYKDHERLEEIYDQNDCNCDTGPPWNKCICCTAGHALNECGEIVGNALQEIDQALKEK